MVRLKGTGFLFLFLLRMLSSSNHWNPVLTNFISPLWMDATLYLGPVPWDPLSVEDLDHVCSNYGAQHLNPSSFGLGLWVGGYRMEPPEHDDGEIPLQWQGGRVSVGGNEYPGTMMVKGNWIVSHKLKLPEETHLKSSCDSRVQLRKLPIGHQWVWRVMHHIVHSGLHFCSKWSSSPILALSFPRMFCFVLQIL